MAGSIGRVMTADDHVLARDLAEEAGRLLLELRARGGDPDVLRKAGDRLSHEFLVAELNAQRPHDAVLSEEGIDDKARLNADRVWIVDPLDGTREFGEEGRTDWAVHVALWERDKGGLTAGAVALPAQGTVLDTANPPKAPADQPQPPGKPLKLVVSRSRAPQLVYDVANIIDAVLVPCGSAGAKVATVITGRDRRLPARRRLLRVGHRRPGGGRGRRRVPRLPHRRQRCPVQPGQPAAAGYPGLPARNRGLAAGSDPGSDACDLITCCPS